MSGGRDGAESRVMSELRVWLKLTLGTPSAVRPLLPAVLQAAVMSGTVTAPVLCPSDPACCYAIMLLCCYADLRRPGDRCPPAAPVAKLC